MLDSDTKRRIDTCRDILVGKVPDPKSQVEQITIALIYKFMDDMDAEAEALGGKRSFFAKDYAKYAWSRLMAPNMGGFDVLSLYSEAIQKMNENPGVPALFRDIFKNAYLPYRDPETLRSFLKEINGFTYDHSERLGDAFEYLLSVLGSQGEAGQFRTPRHIIDFMVEIIDPKKDETILDPACGTAGFLISSYKHILKHNTKGYKEQQDREAYDEKGVPLEALTLDSPLHYKGDLLTPDDKKRLAANIHGYDISPDMVRLSLVNMYLHGFTDPHIDEYDTLTSDERWNELADVILANPPFMSPKGGIKPHKRFSVQATRSEVLFVDYIAEHLTPNGRAAVVVPEGIIFQSGTAYKQLREMLVKNYLVAVISLPAGVFNPYSGVKTSVLVLDKRLAKKTGAILFSKIDNDGYNLGAQRRPIERNDLPAAARNIKAWLESVRNVATFDVERITNLNLVAKEKIGESSEWNLSGDRYREVELKVSTFPHVGLSDIAEIAAGNSAPQDEKYFSGGRHRFIRTSDVGQVHLSASFAESKDKVNDLAVKELGLRLFPKGTILFPKSGASTFLNHRVVLGESAYVSSHLAAIICDTEKAIPEYVYRLLVEVDARNLTPDQAYPSLKLSDISKISIPLPPLEVQKEIVAEIEGYQKIIDGARQVVENYQPHIPIHPDWPMVQLEELIKLTSGQFLSNAMKTDGPYPVYGGNGINGYHSEYFLEEPTIVIGRVGAYCGAVCVTQPKSWVTDNGLYVKEFKREADLSYMALSLAHLNLNQYAKVGGQPSISQSIVLERSIPFPDLDTQRAIVAQIEAEQRLVSANKELIHLFEDRIKATISRVWGEAE